MDIKRSLRTIEEWEHDASLGLVNEPDCPGLAPASGVECPSRDPVIGKVCRAHLHDLPFFIKVAGEKRRVIACKTCGWSGSRKISARRRLINIEHNLTGGDGSE